jgi:hypothetical protein
MTRNSSEVEQAVSRTLRDSLAKLQQTTAELDQAVSDLVSACASARPSNSLPPMLRARSAAASLAASLEVLSKFVLTALQSSPAPAEQELLATDPRTAASVAPVEPMEIESVPPVEPFAPGERIDVAAEPVEPVESVESELPAEPALTEPPPAEPELAAFAAPPAEPQEWVPARKRDWAHEPEPPAPLAAEEPAPVLELASADTTTPFAASYNEVFPPEAAGFDVLALSPEQQELHRRANRVAKVSMQDVKMLRPVDVALGKEHKDLCIRLRDDIEKAHREYDRRFHAIMDHPVDYFYERMVEILGDGDPQALGEYPYPSPALRR